MAYRAFALAAVSGLLASCQPAALSDTAMRSAADAPVAQARTMLFEDNFDSATLDRLLTWRLAYQDLLLALQHTTLGVGMPVANHELLRGVIRASVWVNDVVHVFPLG